MGRVQVLLGYGDCAGRPRPQAIERSEDLPRALAHIFGLSQVIVNSTRKIPSVPMPISLRSPLLK